MHVDQVNMEAFFSFRMFVHVVMWLVAILKNK